MLRGGCWFARGTTRLTICAWKRNGCFRCGASMRRCTIRALGRNASASGCGTLKQYRPMNANTILPGTAPRNAGGAVHVAGALHTGRRWAACNLTGAWEAFALQVLGRACKHRPIPPFFTIRDTERRPAPCLHPVGKRAVLLQILRRHSGRPGFPFLNWLQRPPIRIGRITVADHEIACGVVALYREVAARGAYFSLWTDLPPKRICRNLLSGFPAQCRRSLLF